MNGGTIGRPKVSSVKTPSERLARLQKVGDIAQTLGKYAANWTPPGPFSTTARLGSATAVRGSQAHHVIYSVGKFFELEGIDEALNGLVGERQTRNEMAEALNQIASEVQALIRRIQAGAVAQIEKGSSASRRR